MLTLLFQNNLQLGGGGYVFALAPPQRRVVAQAAAPYHDVRIGFFIKDPNEALDFSVDWRKALASGDTIDASEWTIAGIGTAFTEFDGGFGETGTTRRLSSGEDGFDYTITNRITTDAGRTHEISFRLLVRSSAN